jgi:hypothetical protein
MRLVLSDLDEPAKTRIYFLRVYLANDDARAALSSSNCSYSLYALLAREDLAPQSNGSTSECHISVALKCDPPPFSSLALRDSHWSRLCSPETMTRRSTIPLLQPPDRMKLSSSRPRSDCNKADR